jgi:hypothetical protein
MLKPVTSHAAIDLRVERSQGGIRYHRSLGSRAEYALDLSDLEPDSVTAPPLAPRHFNFRPNRRLQLCPSIGLVLLK